MNFTTIFFNTGYLPKNSDKKRLKQGLAPQNTLCPTCRYAPLIPSDKKSGNKLKLKKPN